MFEHVTALQFLCSDSPILSEIQQNLVMSSIITYIICMHVCTYLCYIYAAMLTHWCEDLGRLMLVRHHNINARVQGTMDVNRDPQQAAIQIAQAAAAHAANQHMNKQPYPRYV